MTFSPTHYLSNLVQYFLTYLSNPMSNAEEMNELIDVLESQDYETIEQKLNDTKQDLKLLKKKCKSKKKSIDAKITGGGRKILLKGGLSQESDKANIGIQKDIHSIHSMDEKSRHICQCTVFITVENNRTGEKLFGSGIYLDLSKITNQENWNKCFLTAEHVVNIVKKQPEMDWKIYVQFRNFQNVKDEKYEVVLGGDGKHGFSPKDYQILFFKDNNNNVPVSVLQDIDFNDYVPPGEKVYILGYPLASDVLKISEGYIYKSGDSNIPMQLKCSCVNCPHIHQIDYSGRHSRDIIISNPGKTGTRQTLAAPGSSGGPIICIRNGIYHLYGILIDGTNPRPPCGHWWNKSPQQGKWTCKDCNGTFEIPHEVYGQRYEVIKREISEHFTNQKSLQNIHPGIATGECDYSKRKRIRSQSGTRSVKRKRETKKLR